MFNHGWCHQRQQVRSDGSRRCFIPLIFPSDHRIEKEQARSMIHLALRGLKESERSTDGGEQPVDLNALSSFVER